jgi:hypothetical protein
MARLTRESGSPVRYGRPISGVSGILDHPLSRMMTAVFQSLSAHHRLALKKSRNSVAASRSPTAE